MSRGVSARTRWEGTVIEQILKTAPAAREDGADITPDWLGCIAAAMINCRPDDAAPDEGLTEHDHTGPDWACEACKPLTEVLRARMRWPSVHWGELHDDAWPSLARAVLAAGYVREADLREQIATEIEALPCGEPGEGPWSGTAVAAAYRLLCEDAAAIARKVVD